LTRDLGGRVDVDRRVLDVLDQLADDGHGLVVGGGDQQHRELVAAEPADRIVAADQCADPVRELREHLVARLVTVLEVDPA
jgi:hypothetical protein